MWNRNTVRLVGAQWLSLFGSKLHLLALPLLIYQRTGSVRLLALGFLAETLPWTLVAPTLSQRLEHANAKWILVAADVLRAALCACLALMPYDTASFLIVMFGLGTLNSVYGTFRLKVLRGSVESDRLQRLLGVSNSGIEVIQIAAPAVGGAVLAFGLSATSLLLADTLSFVISAGLLAGLAVRHVPSQAIREKGKIREGLRELRASHVLWPTTVGESLRSMAEALFVPALIVVIKENFGLPETDLGWAQSCLSVGALAMALAFGRMSAPWYRRTAPWVALTVLGVLQIWLAGGGARFELLAIMLLIGAAMSFRQMSAELTLLENVPESTSGLMISVYNGLIAAAYVVGYLLSASVPSARALLIAAGLCILGGLYQTLHARRLARV